jgi:hypothetical protein
VAAQVREQVGRIGTVLSEPLLLLLHGGAVGEDQVAQVHEPVQLPLARDREPQHAQRSDLRLARRIVVGPGDVIVRAGRDDR